MGERQSRMRPGAPRRRRQNRSAGSRLGSRGRVRRGRAGLVMRRDRSRGETNQKPCAISRKRGAVQPGGLSQPIQRLAAFSRAGAHDLRGISQRVGWPRVHMVLRERVAKRLPRRRARPRPSQRATDPQVPCRVRSRSPRARPASRESRSGTWRTGGLSCDRADSLGPVGPLPGCEHPRAQRRDDRTRAARGETGSRGFARSDVPPTRDG